MVATRKTLERQGEIVTFYYLIFGNRIHAGWPAKEAKKAACDAVALRYNISKGRLLNIISKMGGVDHSRTAKFRAHAEALKDFLLGANDEMFSKCETNKKLIALLDECLNA